MYLQENKFRSIDLRIHSSYLHLLYTCCISLLDLVLEEDDCCDGGSLEQDLPELGQQLVGGQHVGHLGL